MKEEEVCAPRLSFMVRIDCDKKTEFNLYGGVRNASRNCSDEQNLFRIAMT